METEAARLDDLEYEERIKNLINEGSLAIISIKKVE